MALRMQYRPGLLVGFLASIGLVSNPFLYLPPLLIVSCGCHFYPCDELAVAVGGALAPAGELPPHFKSNRNGFEVISFGAVTMSESCPVPLSRSTGTSIFVGLDFRMRRVHSSPLRSFSRRWKTRFAGASFTVTRAVTSLRNGAVQDDVSALFTMPSSSALTTCPAAAGCFAGCFVSATTTTVRTIRARAAASTADRKAPPRGPR